MRPGVLLLAAALSALSAADDRGEPSVLRGIFGIALLFVGPLFGGIFFAFVQLGLYRAWAGLGWMKKENIPMFPFFILRGMIIVIACVAISAIYLKISGHAIPMMEW